MEQPSFSALASFYYTHHMATLLPLLDVHGITYYVDGEIVSQTQPHYTSGAGGVTLMVASAQYFEAKTIMEGNGFGKHILQPTTYSAAFIKNIKTVFGGAIVIFVLAILYLVLS